MPEHSKLPWRWSTITLHHPERMILLEGEREIAFVEFRIAEPLDTLKAESLIQSVNSHHALVEALKVMAEALSDWLYYAHENLSAFDHGRTCDLDEKDLCRECEPAGCIARKINNARQALAQAGYGPESTPQP